MSNRRATLQNYKYDATGGCVPVLESVNSNPVYYPEEPGRLRWPLETVRSDTHLPIPLSPARAKAGKGGREGEDVNARTGTLTMKIPEVVTQQLWHVYFLRLDMSFCSSATSTSPEPYSRCRPFLVGFSFQCFHFVLIILFLFLLIVFS